MVATSISLPKAKIVASSARTPPLVATMTVEDNWNIRLHRLELMEAGGNLFRRNALPIMPIFTASTPMSLMTASICARITSAGIWMDSLDAQRVLGGYRRDGGHRVPAEHRYRLDIGLNSRSATKSDPAMIRTRAVEATELTLVPLRGAKFSMRTELSFRLQLPRNGSRGGLHGLANVIDHPLDERLVVAFGHHSDQRLGARFADRPGGRGLPARIRRQRSAFGRCWLPEVRRRHRGARS